MLWAGMRLAARGARVPLRVWEEPSAMAEDRDSGSRAGMGLGTWIGVGVALGLVFGSAMDNIAVGIAAGVGVGIAIGLALNARGRRSGKGGDGDRPSG